MDQTAAHPAWHIARDIKLSHTVFALPFALLATFLAAGGLPGWPQLALIVVAMVFARTYAMLCNRYVDRHIDKLNPRTADRALPAGRLTPKQVLTVIIACALGLTAAAAGFGFVDGNWWPLIFAPLVLTWLAAYGLIKRYSLLCHFFLGLALAMSPLAAGLAINPAYLAEPPLWLLAGFVALWVAGFDIIYALQDIEHDQRDGLHSIPAKLGTTGALITSKITHLLALACLMMTHRTEPQLHRFFFAGMALVAVALIFEHHAATRGKFNMAFFTANGVIALTLGALGITDTLLH